MQRHCQRRNGENFDNETTVPTPGYVFFFVCYHYSISPPCSDACHRRRNDDTFDDKRILLASRYVFFNNYSISCINAMQRRCQRQKDDKSNNEMAVPTPEYVFFWLLTLFSKSIVTLCSDACHRRRNDDDEMMPPAPWYVFLIFSIF